MDLIAEKLSKKDIIGKKLMTLESQVDSKHKLIERIVFFSLDLCEDCGKIFDSSKEGFSEEHYSSCGDCI